CFLKSLRLGKVDISEALTLVDFHLFDGAKRGQRGFDKRFSNALGCIGVLEEGLTCRTCGYWCGSLGCGALCVDLSRRTCGWCGSSGSLCGRRFSRWST